MKALIVIDMQKDFTTGVLGNPQTAAVVEPVAAEIRRFREEEPDGLVIATLDTHFPDYMNTQEGKFLPVPHCIKDSDGWELCPEVRDALGERAIYIEKNTFGAIGLPELFTDPETFPLDEIRIIGVCTDICVISNAMILKAAFPEVPVKIIANCCAGVTPESHENALSAMRVCQMIVE